MSTPQIPSIVLPIIPSGAIPVGTETETVNDLLEHTSVEFETEWLQDKQLQVLATEFITAGVPGPLWLWVELSPVQSTTSAAYWAAIGGGGGGLAPFVPIVVAATGASLTAHPILIPWVQHSVFARLVVQTPVSATPATAMWIVQALIQGKTT